MAPAPLAPPTNHAGIIKAASATGTSSGKPGGEALVPSDSGTSGAGPTQPEDGSGQQVGGHQSKVGSKP